MLNVRGSKPNSLLWYRPRHDSRWKPSLEAVGLRFLGRGVAFELSSPGLDRLRGRLAAAWQPWLGAQDRQPFRPYVTVQNKVDPSAARELCTVLQVGFAPFPLEGTGLFLWRYLGGPWEALSHLPFAGR